MESKIIKNIVNQPNLVGGVIPMHVFGTIAILQLVSGTAVDYWWVYFAVGYVCLMLIGISACYHRMLSHNSFTVSTPVKVVMLWFATLAGQGNPLFWVTVHSGYHHPHSDSANDVHSPLHGLFHSYIGWMFTLEENRLRPKGRAIRLMADPVVMWFTKHYQTIFWSSHLVIGVLCYEIWLWLIAVPALVTLHSFSINTSFNHIPSLGYKNFKTSDLSINSIVLFPLILGEAWHNNHHANPSSYSFKEKWWELDPTAVIIDILKRK